MTATRPAPSTAKTLIYGLISVALSVLCCLALAEIACRILPTNEGLRAQPVNAASPVFRFTPNRDAVISEGWDFAIVNRVHSNNYGFINNQDYDPKAAMPLLAVVGDSYIEAAITPYEQTVHGRLAKASEGKARVYSFAASGAGLPQYLAWAEYARDSFKPDAMLVSIIGNDFAESLQWREHSPGFHRFDRTPDGGWKLVLTEFTPSPLRTILRHSALVMYLVTNLKVQSLLNFSIHRLGKGDDRWVGNVAAEDSAEAKADFRWAIDIFLDELPKRSGLPPERLMLTVDGIRPDMYDPAALPLALQSTWAEMRHYMIEQARARGITVLDLHEAFMTEFARHGRRFEYPTDSHWNNHGHGVAATEVMKTAAWRSLLGRD